MRRTRPTHLRAVRAAGDLAPGALGTVPALPESADFSSDVWGEAYWLVRPTAQGGTGPGELFVTSGSRIVRDARAELGITGGDVAWTAGLFDAARARVRAQLGSIAVPQPSTDDVEAGGGTIPESWLQILLFATYSLSRGAGTTIVLPGLFVLPRLGDRVGAGDRPTLAAMGFDPAQLTRNPFATHRTGTPVQGVGFNIAGQGNTARRPKRRGKGGLLLLLAIAAAAAAGSS